MAWTKDQDQAAWLANRGSRVFTTLIPKRNVLAYFADRNESEVVIDPRRIRFDALDWPEDQIKKAAGRITERHRSALPAA